MHILLPVIILGSLGAIFGIWLTFAQKIFFVEKDPRVEHIFSLLPGVNCGACGKAGCFGLAEALGRGEVESINCPVADSSVRKLISEAAGIKLDESSNQIAALICNGGGECKDKFKYNGPKDCNIANLIFGGHKACNFACIGFGSCVKACPFDAINMGEDGLPIIDSEKCTACGKCVKACPKDVLVLVPKTSQYHIQCNSKDKAAEFIKACKAGCIACGKCVKICPVSAISITENLALIDYIKCTNCGECVKVCPTKAITKAAIIEDRVR
ncbi:MAG: RnfABCDGE type electron transport complex subunit B [Candidatus Omnitrophota bacterium]